MNKNKKAQEQNNELNLENLEIAVEQAEIVQDDELKMVTGGRSTQYSEWKCRLH